MRTLQALLLLIFLAAVGLFAVQNTAATPVRFLDRSVTAPLALLIVGVYVLGMLSGWTVVSFLRRSIRGVSDDRGR